MTDLSKHSLAELETFRSINASANEAIEAEIERRKEPDYAAWEPKWQAFREAMESPDHRGFRHTKSAYIRALIAAHNTPLAGEDGWIPWTGGECPVPGDTLVTAKFRDNVGDYTLRADSYLWNHTGCRSDIIAYRVVKEP